MTINVRLGDAVQRDERTILPVSLGGLGTTSLTEAKLFLQVVDRSEIGQPGGPIPLNSDGTIDSSYLNLEELGSIPTLKIVSGLVSGNIYLNTDIDFEISNYDSNKAYTITETNACSATYSNKHVIFRATGTNASFKLNGRLIKPTIVIPEIVTPVIIKPSTGSVVDHSSITITTSAFEARGVTNEVHTGTYYKICSDKEGTTAIWSAHDQVNKITTVANLSSPLASGSTVYIFARHEGAITGTSAWSAPAVCTVASMATPSITNLINNATISNTSYTFTSSSFATSGNRTHASTDWKVVLASEPSTVVASVTDSADNLTSWTATNLTPNVPLQVYVRYKDNGGVYTEWSSPINFSVDITIAQPVISYPVTGGTYDNGSLTITSSEFVITADAYTHASSTWQIAKDSTFLDVVDESENDIVNKTSYVCSNLPVNTTLYLRVKYKASNGQTSLWSNIVSFRIEVSIATPSILTPTNNSTVNKNDDGNVTITTSAYTLNGNGYTHTATKWEIATDAEFTTKVVDLTTSDHLTSYTTDVLNYETKYYVRVKYLSGNNLSSEYSDTSVFTTGADYVADPSGRTFARHSSGMGTVMTWVDKQGVTHKTLVLDATYRTKLKWGSRQNYSNMTDYKNKQYYFVDGTSSGSGRNEADWESASTESAFLGAKKTDAIINAWSGYFEDAKSSKQETDLMMAVQSSTNYAAGWCRSKLVNGIGCDLPNIQTLVRIYCSMFQLDSLDPTATGNKYLFTKARSNDQYNWSFDSAYYAWSSTEWGTSSASTQCAWYVNYTGYANGTNKFDTYGVVPVLEITES